MSTGLRDLIVIPDGHQSSRIISGFGLVETTTRIVRTLSNRFTVKSTGSPPFALQSFPRKAARSGTVASPQCVTTSPVRRREAAGPAWTTDKTMHFPSSSEATSNPTSGRRGR
eukprot:327465_1